MFFFQETGLDYVLNEDKSFATSATPNSDNSQGETGSQSGKRKPEGTLEDHNRTCRVISSDTFPRSSLTSMSTMTQQKKSGTT